jgi:uncharacterized protein (TIGR03083 family)
MTANVPSPDDWLAALVSSYQRLAASVAQMTAEEVAGPSYASDWSVAQVLSHLGSGAEIFTLFLRAGLQGEPAPGVAAFEPVWERWNSKSPEDQAADALVADRQFLDELEALDAQERQSWHLSMFGGDQQLADLLRLRTGEHAVHTWDVGVIKNPDAAIGSDAVELLIDTLDQLVARVGRAPDQPIRVQVTTVGPARQFLLVVDGEGAALLPRGEDGPAGGDKTLQLPAEAFIRLVYGRLDPRHTPALQGDDADLEALRRIFPGF